MKKVYVSVWLILCTFKFVSSQDTVNVISNIDTLKIDKAISLLYPLSAKEDTSSMQEVIELIHKDSTMIIPILKKIASSRTIASKSIIYVLERLDYEKIESPLLAYLNDCDDYVLPYTMYCLERVKSKNSAYINFLSTSNNKIRYLFNNHISTTSDVNFVAIALNGSAFGFNIICEIFRDAENQYNIEISDENFNNALGFVASSLVGVSLNLDQVVNYDAYEYLDNVFMGSYVKPSIKVKYYPIFSNVLMGIKEFQNPNLIPTIMNEIYYPYNRDKVVKNYYNYKHIPLVDELMNSIAKLGPAALPYLFNYIKQQNEYLRRIGKDTFYRITDETSVPILLGNLNNENDIIRENCCTLLGNMKAKVAIPYLEPLLNDNNNRVRKAAEKSLEKLNQ